jgi:uncharacterized protein (UPF0333 family)
MSTGNSELLFVLMVMGVLFIAGIAAVYIFIRQWRKEHRSNGGAPLSGRPSVPKPEARAEERSDNKVN